MSSSLWGCDTVTALRSRPFVFIATVIGLFFTCDTSVRLAANDDTELGRAVIGDELASTLEMIATHCKASIEQVKTWRGECVFLDAKCFNNREMILPTGNEESSDWIPIDSEDHEAATFVRGTGIDNGYWLIQRGTCSFVLDNDHVKYRAFHKPVETVEAWDLTKQEKFQSKRARRSSYTITSPESVLEFSPTNAVTRLQTSGNIIAENFPKARAVYVLAPLTGKAPVEIVDVRECFSINRVRATGEGMWYWKRPERFAAVAKKNTSDQNGGAEAVTPQLYVTETSQPTYSLVISNTTGNSLKLVFDGSVGFNVTSCTQTTNNVVNLNKTLKYEQKNEVYIPVECSEWRTTVDGSGKPSGAFGRVMKIETSALNQEIDENEFDIRRLNYKYGDRMFEEQTSKISVFDGEEFVSADDFQFDEERWREAQSIGHPSKQAPKPAPVAQGNRWLLLINIVVALLVVVLIVARTVKSK